MFDIYKDIKFDNIDGGVWKQGWDIQYDKEKIKEEKKLKVFIVPHSHNDPGWIKTFENYFLFQTEMILDNMYNELTSKEDLKFIYAEMSFFELWWSKKNEQIRNNVKKLLKSGQLEIVTGGWVMTDEANSNYFSIIMELIEGHEFLKNQLDFIPKNHWSIDPFGLSSTVAYINNRANLSNMVIGRVHYSVKKYLAQKKKLEFIWRQSFAGNSINTDITTHMFPFYSYDIPHTCGPDPKICCQFDFARLNNNYNCPWNIPPTIINENNVKNKANILADQYRKKAQLFQSNSLLVPLGDDFRYDSKFEWNNQYYNYKELINYINENKELNMEVKFGTLNDYFESLKKDLNDANKNLSVLSGDFFTYADRDDHYWSGYFTSRPFYKHLDRTLQHYVRSADILFSLTLALSNDSIKQSFAQNQYNLLVDARRALGLFQHHDGVTGTSKPHVMKDYESKMLDAINKCKSIISNASHLLLKLPIEKNKFLDLDEMHYSNDLPKKKTIEIDDSLFLFNTLEQFRSEVVCINVKSLKSVVVTNNGEKILQQIGPIFYSNNKSLEHHKEKFELCFLAKIKPFFFSIYKVIESNEIYNKVTIKSPNDLSVPNFDVIKLESEPILSNINLKAYFDYETGFLKNIISNNMNISIKLSFVKYQVWAKSKPGAYLFLPEGSSIALSTNENLFVVVNGPIRQYIYIKGFDYYGIEQFVYLDVNSHSLSIKNKINLKSHVNPKENVEIAMCIDSSNNIYDENNDDELFFTDLNNFQMIRRQRLKKIPIQGHFFPMSGVAFIENNKYRLTLLGRQALGVSNLKKGKIEVMLDRRLTTDDELGLGMGIYDNRQTISQFQLFIDKSTFIDKKSNDKKFIDYLLLPAYLAQLSMHYPFLVLSGKINKPEIVDQYPIINDLSFPCDVHIVALRTLSQPTLYNKTNLKVTRNTLPKNSLALIIYRYKFDCNNNDQFKIPSCKSFLGKVDINPLFKSINLKSVNNASLTLLYKDEKPLENLIVNLDLMELRTLVLNF